MMIRPSALLAVAARAAVSGAAVGQQDGRSTEHEHYGDPGEGHFGDPAAGHFGSPPREIRSDFKPVTVRPLKPFDSRYLESVPETDTRLDDD